MGEHGGLNNRCPPENGPYVHRISNPCACKEKEATNPTWIRGLKAIIKVTL
jgi:hypothetical protein